VLQKHFFKEIMILGAGEIWITINEFIFKQAVESLGAKDFSKEDLK
jgi:hypothetical protein